MSARMSMRKTNLLGRRTSKIWKTLERDASFVKDQEFSRSKSERCLELEEIWKFGNLKAGEVALSLRRRRQERAERLASSECGSRASSSSVVRHLPISKVL